MQVQQRSAKAVERAYSILEIKAVKETDDQRIIEGVATTPSVDRMGDIVDPLGAEFKLPLPLLWQHNHDEPIGHVEYAKATKTGIPFRAKIAKVSEPGRLKDRLDEAWQSIKVGLVRAVSIGFRNIEHSVMENGGWKFIRWEMLELSAVTIPANAEATINTIKSFDRQFLAASGRSERGVRITPAGVTASSKQSLLGATTMARTISEQISALEATLEQKKALAQSIQEKATSEGRTKDENEQDQFDEAVKAAGDVKKEIEDLKTLEVLGVSKARPVGEVKSADDAAAARSGDERKGDRRTTVVGPTTPKGIGFVRYVKCLHAASNNPELAAMLAEKNYPDDKRIANYARMTPEEKSAVGAAYTGGSGWADALATANLVNEFIDLLRAEVAYSKFGQGGVPDFRRVPFNVKVPRQTGGTTANWVGEAKPIPVSKGTFDQVTMGKTKIAAMTYASKEQLRFSAVNAEALLLNDLVLKSAEKIDTSMFSTAAASSGVSPAGLLNGLSALSTAGTDFDDIIADLVTLYTPFSAAKIKRSGLVIVTNEDLANAIGSIRTALGVPVFDLAQTGRLNGYPVVASGNVAAGDVIMVSAPSILLADDRDAEVSVSDQASIEALDGSLVQNGQDGTGTSLISLWQTESVGIKVVHSVNWQKASTAAVAYIGTAGYGGAPSA